MNWKYIKLNLNKFNEIKIFKLYYYMKGINDNKS